MQTQFAETLYDSKMQVSGDFAEQTLRRVNTVINVQDTGPAVEADEPTPLQTKIFLENLKRLNKFLKARNHYPRWSENSSLCQWVRLIRSKKVRGVLYLLFENQLNECGFVWDVKHEKFPRPSNQLIKMNGAKKHLKEEAKQQTGQTVELHVDQRLKNEKKRQSNIIHLSYSDKKNLGFLVRLYAEGKLNNYYSEKIEKWLADHDGQVPEGDLDSDVILANRKSIAAEPGKGELRWHKWMDMLAVMLVNNGGINQLTEPMANWVRRQIELYKLNKIKASRLKKWETVLQLTPAGQPMSEQIRTLWSNHNEALLQYRKQHKGKMPEQDCADAHDRQLADWYQLLIFQKKNELLPVEWKKQLKEIMRPLHLTKEEKKAAIWQFRFEEIKEHVALHNGEVPKRYEWGKYIRYREMVKAYPSFTPEQKDLFDSLGIAKLTFRKKWHEIYEVLKKFVEINQRLPTKEDDKYLYVWLNFNKKSGRQHKLPASKYKQLANIGVDFALLPPRIAIAKPHRTRAEMRQQLEENWNMRYRELIAYRIQNPHRWPLFKSVLGKWCLAQKTAQSGLIKYKLPQDRIVKLNEIGFVWKSAVVRVDGD